MRYLALVLLSVVFLGLVNAYPIYPKPKDNNGNLMPFTLWNYTFNFSNDSTCTDIVLSNWSNITTGSDGIGFIDINITELFEQGIVPTHLCEYRNGTIRLNKPFPDMIFRNLLTQNITTLGLLNITSPSATANMMTLYSDVNALVWYINNSGSAFSSDSLVCTQENDCYNLSATLDDFHDQDLNTTDNVTFGETVEINGTNYTTKNGTMFYYDNVRAKWLSTEEYCETAGRNAIANDVRVYDNAISTTTARGIWYTFEPITLTGLYKMASNTPSATFTVRKNSTAIKASAWSAQYSYDWLNINVEANYEINFLTTPTTVAPDRPRIRLCWRKTG